MIATLTAARGSHQVQLGIDDIAAELRNHLSETFRSLAVGRWDEALERADAFAATGRRVGNRFTSADLDWVVAEVPGRRGDLHAADVLRAASLGAGFGSSRIAGLRTHSALVWTLAEMGEHEAARRQARELEEAIDCVDDLRGLGARVAAAQGAAATDNARADAHFRRALETARQYELPFAEIHALDAWATRTGDHHHLTAAEAIVDRIGAGGDWTLWLATRSNQ